jgi:hypothetical protein
LAFGLENELDIGPVVSALTGGMPDKYEASLFGHLGRLLVIG